MSKQAKRGPGRPPLENKESVQDMHLRVPLRLLEAIDGIREGRSRTDIILEAIELHSDISRWIRYYGKK